MLSRIDNRLTSTALLKQTHYCTWWRMPGMVLLRMESSDVSHLDTVVVAVVPREAYKIGERVLEVNAGGYQRKLGFGTKLRRLNYWRSSQGSSCSATLWRRYNNGWLTKRHTGCPDLGPDPLLYFHSISNILITTKPSINAWLTSFPHSKF